MTVEKKGNGGWTMRVTCTGSGNGGKGCRAVLRINRGDIYKTFSTRYERWVETGFLYRREYDKPVQSTHWTITCPECGAETDLVYRRIPNYNNIPSKKVWMARCR